MRLTIDDVEKLRIQEVNNELRFPNVDIDESQVDKAFYIAWLVYNITNNKLFLSRLMAKLALKKLGVEITGKGTKKNPYKIKTEFGESEFYPVAYLFVDKKCPFEVGMCFKNAFNIAGEMSKLKSVKSCDCVSGLSLIVDKGEKRSIMHSVAELNNHLIIDVNWGIVMDKDLYKKLFMFEELVRLKGKQVPEMMDLLSKDESRRVMRRCNVRDYHMVFAPEDIMEFFNNKARQFNQDPFQDLNY